jgi:mono/diheme cytochrome c family protein
MSHLLAMLLFTQAPVEKPEWWFFARPLTGDNRTTQAFGPYGSREECKAVAHPLMPDDRRFWNRAQMKAADDPKAKPKPATYAARTPCKQIK